MTEGKEDSVSNNGISASPSGSNLALVELFDVNSPTVLYNLGCYLLEVGDEEAAKEAFRRSDCIDGLLALADLHFSKRRFVECESIWRQIGTVESLERICAMKEFLRTLDPFDFILIGSGVETTSIAGLQGPSTSHEHVSKSVSTAAVNDQLDQLNRVILVFERLQQQKGGSPLDSTLSPSFGTTTPSTRASPSSTLSTLSSLEKTQVNQAPLPSPTSTSTPTPTSTSSNTSPLTSPKVNMLSMDVEQEAEEAMSKWGEIIRQKERSYTTNGTDTPKMNVSNPRATKHLVCVTKDGAQVGNTTNIPEELRKVLVEEGIIHASAIPPAPENGNNASLGLTSSSSVPAHLQHSGIDNERGETRRKRGMSLRKSVSQMFKGDVTHEGLEKDTLIKIQPTSPSHLPTSSSTSSISSLSSSSTSSSSSLSSSSSKKSKSKEGLLKRFVSSRIEGGSRTRSATTGSSTSPPLPTPAVNPVTDGPVFKHKGHIGIDAFGTLAYELPPDILNLLKPAVQ